jgi:hypothetical protein
VTTIEDERGKQADLEGKAECALLDDLPWGQTSLVRVGTSWVEAERVDGDLGQELGAAREAFRNSSSMRRTRGGGGGGPPYFRTVDNRATQDYCGV